jgi:hypothetical protein
MEQNPRRLPINATFEDFEAFFSVQLLPDEKILFSTKGRVTAGILKDIPGYVTNQRVFF